MNQKPFEVIRYKNRKLYALEGACYVNHRDLMQVLASGRQLRVYSRATNPLNNLDYTDTDITEKVMRSIYKTQTLPSIDLNEIKEALYRADAVSGDIAE